MKTTVPEKSSFHILFGGTFNPIHMGHLALVEFLLKEQSPQKIFVVPAGINPFKHSKDLLPSDLRLAMVKATFEGMKKVEVLPLELNKQGPSYTVETVEALAKKFPDTNLKIAMGSDVFSGFSQWRSPKRILELASVLLIMRKGTVPPQENLMDGLLSEMRGRVIETDPGGYGFPHQGLLVQQLNPDLPQISATEIRNNRDLSLVPEKARGFLEKFWAERKKG